MRVRLIISTAVLALVSALPADAQPRGRARGQQPAQTTTQQPPAQIRFQAMDRNNDRIITRAEWQGSAQSFTVHDWNGDGVLSGEEVRIGAWPSNRDPIDFDQPDREYPYQDWTTQGFTNLDHNRDGRITLDEWHFDRQTFRRVDHNNDGVISRAEFLAEDAMDDDRGDRFVDLDGNGDGRLSRAEWHGTLQLFDALDANHDGFVSRLEMNGTGLPRELFPSLDVNRDNVITWNEWHWSRATFDRRDPNRDGRITRDEFNGPGTVGTTGTRSTAYNAGYERGAAEARAQARADREQNHGYDAEGQRELETANSGYEARLGPLADYQAGYRAGWRRGYPEGWRLP